MLHTFSTWTFSIVTGPQLASTGSSSTCSLTFCKIKIKWTAWSCQTSAKDQSETYLPLCTILTTGDKNAWDDFIRYFPVWIWHVRRKRRSCSVCSGVWVWGANHLAVLLVCFDISQLSSCDLFQLRSVLLNDWMVCKLSWCFLAITFDDCHGQQWLCAILWKFLINMCLTHAVAHQFYSQWSITLSLFCEWNWNWVEFCI